MKTLKGISFWALVLLMLVSMIWLLLTIAQYLSEHTLKPEFILWCMILGGTLLLFFCFRNF
jgi:hypothetical protein